MIYMLASIYDLAYILPVEIEPENLSKAMADRPGRVCCT